MTDTPESSSPLMDVARQHGLSITESQAALLADYCQRVWAWNERLNLTRHTDWNLFVTRDLLDSVRLAEHLEPHVRLLDVGSGGGVPGIVVAILRPDVSVTVCDSVGKKATALQDIVTGMGLNVTVLGQRVQDILKEQRFGCVTVRAVGAMDKLLPWFQPLWDYGAQALLIKGPRWKEELAEVQRSGKARGRRIERIASWGAPGRDGESVLLRIQ
jgi:16S rRNA (guanine527-N7)-methyltransferase